MNLTPELLEKLAEAAHQVWVESKVAEGFEYAPETDKANKKHSCLMPYDGLSETDKEGDRAFVRGIPAILEKAGLEVVYKNRMPVMDGGSSHGWAV